jgi:hypothetical protein
VEAGGAVRCSVAMDDCYEVSARKQSRGRMEVQMWPRTETEAVGLTPCACYLVGNVRLDAEFVLTVSSLNSSVWGLGKAAARTCHGCKTR